ncbi:MAG: class I SAM-dependent methyltransferase [Magnetococcales bacterium]|nr:class I SAM-dependent methyltransferase [Magnetococcales bacterium]
MSVKATKKEERFSTLYDIWERRWVGSDSEEKLTRLGLQMFKAKEKSLSKLLGTLDVKNVIEVGCGLGHIQMVYKKLGYSNFGIDVSPTAITVCRNKGLDVELCAVEEETRKFDLVSSDGMLEHFLNFEPMAQHMMRLSSRYVLIIQPNHGSFMGKTLPYLAELLRGDDIVMEYNYRIDDFIDIFKRNGFTIRQNIPVFMDVFRILLFERDDEGQDNPSILSS